MKTTYTIEIVEHKRLCEDSEYLNKFMVYLREVGPELTKMFGNKLNWRNSIYPRLVVDSYFLVCIRNGEIVGHMICNLGNTPLDPSVKILRQISFYTKPNSGRAAYLLFQKFIDIGRKEANHIITMLTSHTNIKPETLERYGFSELETLYRMEV